ncbi:epsilon-antitoxin [Streptococcus suis]|uniref:epsilon-antitoxin n=1 Tax=Streptococcus suis TaxID=1307 RepID=UPI001C9395A1|nr:epsilon-antitoxin [Streptococcus suis]MBY5015370.1 epsilon-antitoxin [Streptococcus suis]MBY5030717.1 epsilon-antitoxin [Streptococcus suis]HEM5110991.1 epsilon-antitoxin [Streptococcus suis]
MSIDIVEQQEKLLLACITLNFVEDLEEFKEYKEYSAEEKGYKAVLEYVDDLINSKVGVKTLEKIFQGNPSTPKTAISDRAYNAIFENEIFSELSEKIYEGIQNNDAEIMKKVSDIIEYRIENKEFPKILEKMKKSSNRHYALPMLLQNEQLLTNVLDYLPLIEKIFESEENVTVFCQLAERLEMFKIVEEFEDWENVEQFIKSVQTRNGFDNYID